MNAPVPPLQWLLECSKSSLEDFMLTNLARSANRRKEVQGLLMEWVEAAAVAMLAEWFKEHGEELMALASAPAVDRERLAKELNIDLPHKLTNPAPRSDVNRQSPFRPPHRVYRKVEKAG